MSKTRRIRIIINGAVQGVGFRPFIYRLAEEMQLPGWVNNTAQGVIIEVEGLPHRLEWFLERIKAEQPPHALIQRMEHESLDPVGFTTFEIRSSDAQGGKTALLLPDLATCSACLAEIFDPQNRRYLYPFTNCTHCGPRFSIIEGLPYDRPNTSMKRFAMCPQCQAEYDDPLDRRFHAQPNACPACGPQVELWDQAGKICADHHDAVLQTVDALREGKIGAIKGLGGFHLMVDARNEDAVDRLRMLKRREEKPLALMFPDVESLRLECHLSDLEERILVSAESPIVLLERLDQINSVLAENIAPHNPYLGAMLPYTPLHHILMGLLKFPIVATSGNLSDEPICIDEHEALQRLHGLADIFLVHNRPIVRHVDDSIVRVMMDRQQIMRRARGYAPLPVDMGGELASVLAVGAHLKNTISLSRGTNIFISQHIGDLETEQAYKAFEEVISSFQKVFEAKPQAVVCDLHPDYLSTQFAKQSNASLIQVQHHYAHVLSCMAENQIDKPVLGVSWDGTGLGQDGTIWGGEFLLADRDGYQRVAHLRTFPLPSGDKAIKQPQRTALGLLYECMGEAVFNLTDAAFMQSFPPADLRLLGDMLRKDIQCPRTSSAGRLFDGAASIVADKHKVSYEGQAAMELEFALHGVVSRERYPFEILSTENAALVVDWSTTMQAILTDAADGVSIAQCSARFHNTLVEMIVDIAIRVDQKDVVLTGGCFQNRYLCENAVRRLSEEGFTPYWHSIVPPNDGGISLGQAVYACRRLQKNL